MNERLISPPPEIEVSLESEAKPIIEALTAKYPSATFELIGDIVMCTDVRGIDFGDPNVVYDSRRSWDSIMADPEDERFIITVNGKRYDTRAGMTYEAYEELLRAKKDVGEMMPDGDYEDWAALTWVTGDKNVQPDAVDVPVAWVNDDGSVNRFNGNRKYDRYNHLVRPAVKIKI